MWLVWIFCSELLARNKKMSLEERRINFLNDYSNPVSPIQMRCFRFPYWFDFHPNIASITDQGKACPPRFYLLLNARAVVLGHPNLVACQWQQLLIGAQERVAEQGRQACSHTAMEHSPASSSLWISLCFFSCLFFLICKPLGVLEQVLLEFNRTF